MLVGILISMHGFNSLKCLMTPDFFFDHFLYQLLYMFHEKLKKIGVLEV